MQHRDDVVQHRDAVRKEEDNNFFEAEAAEFGVFCSVVDSALFLNQVYIYMPTSNNTNKSPEHMMENFVE